MQDTLVEALREYYQDGQRGFQTIAGVKTNASGNYVIHDLPPDRYTVRVNTVQYSDPRTGHYYGSSETAPLGRRVTVTTNTQSTSIDIQLRRGKTFHIRGVIEGIPQGSSVSVSALSCPELSWENAIRRSYVLRSVKPPQGRAEATFDLEKVSPGRYCLRAEITPGSAISPRSGAIVTVTNADSDGVRMVVEAPTPWTGVVRVEGLELGKVSPPYVGLWQGIREPVRGNIDPQSGAFRLDDVRPGEDYRIGMRVFPGYVKSVKLNGRELPDGVIRNSPAYGSLEIVIAPARSIVKGKVSFDGSEPERAFVLVVPADEKSSRMDLIRSGVADERGQFEVKNVASGTYKVIAWGRYENKIESTPEFLAMFQGPLVEVRDGETIDVEVRFITDREFEEAKARF